MLMCVNVYGVFMHACVCARGRVSVCVCFLFCVRLLVCLPGRVSASMGSDGLLCGYVCQVCEWVLSEFFGPAGARKFNKHCTLRSPCTPTSCGMCLAFDICWSYLSCSASCSANCAPVLDHLCAFLAPLGFYIAPPCTPFLVIVYFVYLF